MRVKLTHGETILLAAIFLNYSTDTIIAWTMSGQIDQTAAIASLRQAIEQTSPFAEAQMLFCSDFTLRRYCLVFVKRVNLKSLNSLLSFILSFCSFNGHNISK
jgi:hypothetical protein